MTPETLRVAVVGHALVQEGSRARWRRLAERHAAEVTLLVPGQWQAEWFGNSRTWRCQPEQYGRYRVLPLPITRPGNWNSYLFRSTDAGLCSLHPDVIYVVQEEGTLVLQQLLLYRRLWAPGAKLAFFSWNNLQVATPSWRSRMMWRRVCAGADAAIAGSTEVRRVLQDAGFPKPVHVQTEIGVDEERFRPDPAVRAELRARLGLHGFVIGFAGRLTEAKGVLDLAAAAARLAGDWSLLLVGDGDLRPRLEAVSQDPRWAGRLHITGQVDLAEMPRWLQPMDCLVLPSRTTPAWKEQFGLVLAEAMACGVPVVGSDSGAIPEVIGEGGMVFPEGDAAALHGCLSQLMADEARRRHLAEAGRERCLAMFSSAGLADETYRLFCEMKG